MNKLHSMILQKTTEKYKVPGKKYYVKRKKEMYKLEFKKFLDGNYRK